MRDFSVVSPFLANASCVSRPAENIRAKCCSLKGTCSPLQGSLCFMAKLRAKSVHRGGLVPWPQMGTENQDLAE